MDSGTEPGVTGKVLFIGRAIIPNRHLAYCTQTHQQRTRVVKPTSEPASMQRCLVQLLNGPRDGARSDTSPKNSGTPVSLHLKGDNIPWQ